MSARKSTAPAARPTRWFRVDPRLVHATMMNVWVPTTGARRLIIADMEVAANARRRAILEMSAMGEADVVFTTEHDVAAELAKLPTGEKAIVLFSNLEGAVRAADANLQIDRLNVGHVPAGPGRTPIHPACHLGSSDYSVIRALQERGIEVFAQPLPQDEEILIAGRVKRSHPPPASAPAAVPSKPPPSRANGEARLEAAKPPPPPPKPPPPEPGRLEERMRVLNARGLHLRAASLFAQVAGKLPCEVRVSFEGSTVNAKSLLGLTTLGATCGSMIDVEVDGDDPAACMKEIRKLFESGFEEGADWVPDGTEEERT